jgi:2-oxo-4-hydroxy-4-carboxy-5-ureidoimidazoline decarboxylase
MRVADVNVLDRSAFVSTFGGVFEHSPWVAEGAWAMRPFSGIDALHAAMLAVVDAADEQRQLALLRAHPELAGKAAVRGELTADSTKEQAGAGLSQCTPDEFARLQELNARYNEKFGFPFILAVKGYDRGGILNEFARRVENDRGTEFAECLGQIAKITRFRLNSMLES